MRITLKQLKVFSLTAKYGSISTAADHAFLSQPAASSALAELESGLDQPLFHRKGKRLILNELGHDLLPLAVEILAKAMEFERRILPSSTDEGTLRLAASTTIADYILPKIIHDFCETYPKLRVELIRGNTHECLDQLKNFKVDLALVEGFEMDASVILQEWNKDRMQIFCHPRHPLLHKSCISLKDLEDYPWVLRESGSGTQQVFLDAIKNNHLQINLREMLSASITIVNYVRENPTLLSCLSESVLKDFIAQGVIKPIFLENLNIERNFYIAALKNIKAKVSEDNSKDDSLVPSGDLSELSHRLVLSRLAKLFVTFISKK